MTKAGPFERLAPRALKPYVALIRLDKPTGTWLLLWPCFWAIALAAEAWPDGRLLGLFAAGALVMRSAGCIYNDIVDREFDSQVARTQHRPLASGALRVRHAVLFTALLLAAGLAILVQLHWLAIVLGIGSLALVFTYPLMKRITYWPQAFLGLTFNWGALVGYTAASSPEASLLSLLVDASSLQPSFSGAVLTTMSSGSIAHAVPLYCAGVCWTLVYDTLYGYQDRKDDARIG